MYKVWDLFAGGGGFSYGLHRTGGFETTLFCEINPYARKVLNKNYPDVPIIDDVTKIDRGVVEKYGRPDVVTAGIPCQGFSIAGKRLGTKDERFLWNDTFRVLQYTRPSFFILENVANLLRDDGGYTFGGILFDLAQIGYDAEWRVFTAKEFGYPHKRERVYILAYPHQIGRQRAYLQQQEEKLDAYQLVNPTLQGARATAMARELLLESTIFGSNDGVSKKLYRNHKQRNQVMGNAIIPDIAEAIGNSIIRNFGID